ncbi:unnamed protein product [Effrenium voratum]|uniref:Uncharacterized protein n=1 Tax=Effrenium voratum TaxID=2562239 RepID=A0AA36I2P6_9DINO|nr:unnamed protein product [Effrenium voratum]
MESLTAVVSHTLAAELAEICTSARQRAAESRRRNAAWLEELPEATVPRKRQKREEDIGEHQAW